MDLANTFTETKLAIGVQVVCRIPRNITPAFSAINASVLNELVWICNDDIPKLAHYIIGA